MRWVVGRGWPAAAAACRTLPILTHSFVRSPRTMLKREMQPKQGWRPLQLAQQATCGPRRRTPFLPFPTSTPGAHHLPGQEPQLHLVRHLPAHREGPFQRGAQGDGQGHQQDRHNWCATLCEPLAPRIVLVPVASTLRSCHAPPPP